MKRTPRIFLILVGLALLGAVAAARRRPPALPIPAPTPRLPWASSPRLGSSGLIASSPDGGVTWSSQASPTTATLNGVWFVSGTTGWAVGDGGRILKTTTGGR